MMKTSDKLSVQYFVEAIIANGVEEIVVSPGSRNAPLVIAMDEHPGLNCTLIHDERSAAFVAMGMITQTNKPVAVVCTSGSAVLNYFPAVAEAFYQSLPLIIISADRPKEWINHGQGQTIMQAEVFGKHVIGYEEFHDLDTSKRYLDNMVGAIDRMFDNACGNARVTSPF